MSRTQSLIESLKSPYYAVSFDPGVSGRVEDRSCAETCAREIQEPTEAKPHETAYSLADVLRDRRFAAKIAHILGSRP